METGFPDKMEPKYKTKKAPWNFEAPMYDQRSSCYVNAGSHYGVGHRNPVGHDGKVKATVACLPDGRVRTQKVSEIPTKNLDIYEVD